MNRTIKPPSQLFELWCEVEPVLENDTDTMTGKVISYFPEKFSNKQTLTDVGDFAVPCRITKRSEIQHYTFVLTDITSQWRFGYCRYDSQSNRAMVVITHFPWHNQFRKFLNHIAELRHSSFDESEQFLKAAYAVEISDPGTVLSITTLSGANNFQFDVPWHYTLPILPEDHNLSNYYNFVEVDNMINIFCALFSERRIIFTSQKLDILSSCVIAASELIYPMVWQHIFAPILPLKLKEYVNAPMPYLIGIPEPILRLLNSNDLNDVVFFDCDTNHFISPYEDRKNFPKHVLEELKRNLNNHATILKGDGVSRSFLRAIVQLVGGYRDGLQFTGGKIEFNDRQFIAARPQRLRNFLEKVLELQIFRQFIDARLVAIKEGFSDEFEAETKKNSENKTKKFNIMKNFKDLVK